MRFKSIIAATDFSPGAEDALGQALLLARQHGARLMLVHVLPPLVTPSPLLDEFVVNQTTLALRQGLKESCQEALNKRRREAAPELDLEVRLLEGDPPRELVRLAKEEGADLMVMGSTGVSGLAETVFGSVAQKMVRRSPCSVLVARPLATASVS
ncbi:MAG: universal stress protein [Proteobacteria bacterium]|nr:universal stress protein [Pseudomonadota bacterium]MBU1450746.1 universal stress protein [Pseudomonadota bacterium]MBU2468381.1 universal stress protein [Pseudomonadota bacterium]MBU2519254.1 universal stress protein [Pseudomonadota bacterium]